MKKAIYALIILVVLALATTWYLCRDQRLHLEVSSISQANNRRPFSYVKITGKQKVVGEQGCTWQCRGTTNLANGAILVALLRYFNPVADTVIDQKNITVTGKKFQVSFGEFRKEFLPGNYGITVYFSPQIQSTSFAATFCEDEMVFRLGTPADYRRVFYARKKIIEELFALNKQLWDKTVQDYQSAKSNHRIQRWDYRAGQRRKELQRLRAMEKLYCSQYQTPFFHLPYKYIFQLANLIDFLEGSAEAALQGKGEDMPRRRIAQFIAIYPEAWNHFRYEMAAAAPAGSNLLVTEMIDWLGNNVVSRQSGTSSPEQVRTIAPLLLRLEKLHRGMKSLPTSQDQFIAKSNLWFFKICQLATNAEDRARQLPIIAPPSLLYQLLLALFRSWSDLAKQVGIAVTALDKKIDSKGSRFAQQWQELLAERYFQMLLPLILREDLDWLRRHLRDLSEQMNQGGIIALSDELLQRQQNNWRLASLYISPRSKEWINEYNRLCAYTIDLCTAINENDDARMPATLQQRIKRLIKQLKLLRDRLPG